MPSDKARKTTEKELAKMEKHVDKIYSEAYDDISKSWNKFMESHAPKLEKAQKELEEAKKSGDKDAIKDATEKYERIAKNITINDQRYQAMVDETAAKLAHTNEVAIAYVNNQMPNIYTTNYNAFGDYKVKGYSFSLVNENAVKNLAKTDKTLLPKKKVDVSKDMKWNEKNINSQMIQGILQGESIPKMAKRLMNVTNMNQASAIRNARTMTTSAENKGRQDSFEKAQEDGVIMTREWIATNDDRTRAWHSDLDGVEVGVDEPWDNEYGEIMYPGDPDADPANVYNCRCSIRAHVKGFKPSESYEEKQEAIEEIKEESLDNLKDVNIGDLSEMDETLKNEMLQEVNDILDDFEKAKPYITSIEAMEDGDFFDVGGYEPFGSLSINTFEYIDRKEAIENYNDMIKHKETAGKSPINLMSHECGHLLERAYMTVQGEGYDEKDWNSHKYAKIILNDVRKEMGITKEKENELIAQLSKYATEDAGEALAECISNYRAYGNDANPLSIAVYEYLKKKLN